MAAVLFSKLTACWQYAPLMEQNITALGIAFGSMCIIA